jgi:hypothetical protein
VNEAKEVNRSTIIANGKASEVSEAVEASFDAVSMLVDGSVVRNGDLSGPV